MVTTTDTVLWHYCWLTGYVDCKADLAFLISHDSSRSHDATTPTMEWNWNNVRKTLPAYLGRPPRNIVLYYNGYKAEEWFTWITLYSLPLLKDRLPIRLYKGWANFVKAVRLCNKLVLTPQDIKNIRFLFYSFYIYYERYVNILFNVIL